MKKTIILAILVLTYTSALAQRKNATEEKVPSYFWKVYFGMNFEKKDSSSMGKTIEATSSGVYGGKKIGFAHAIYVDRPLKTSKNPGLWQQTSIMIGPGINRILDYNENELNLTAGIVGGINLTPKIDSVKRKNNNDVFIGGGVFGNIRNESGFELDANLRYHYLPVKNDSAWGENILTAGIDFRSFFGKTFGLGVGYKIMAYTTSERDVPGKPSHGSIIQYTRSELNFSLCARIKPCTISLGFLIPWEKESYRDNHVINDKLERTTGKIAMKAGLIFNFENMK